jgi:hypothetical protein
MRTKKHLLKSERRDSICNCLTRQERFLATGFYELVSICNFEFQVRKASFRNGDLHIPSFAVWLSVCFDSLLIGADKRAHQFPNIKLETSFAIPIQKSLLALWPKLKYTARAGLGESLSHRQLTAKY